jgi:hypothetical protein
VPALDLQKGERERGGKSEGDEELKREGDEESCKYLHRRQIPRRPAHGPVPPQPPPHHGHMPPRRSALVPRRHGDPAHHCAAGAVWLRITTPRRAGPAAPRHRGRLAPPNRAPRERGPGERGDGDRREGGAPIERPERDRGRRARKRPEEVRAASGNE